MVDDRTNLVANSVKYTPHGSVRIRLTATDTDAVLTVADTGPGIATDKQPLVFNRFYRAADGEEQGAGIGLAVVADLVRAHHGRLDLDSTPGRGSAFTVTVPIVVTSRSTHAPGGSTAASDQPLNGEARPSVLVVEDDTDLREFLTRLLTGDGWLVHAAGDAETALDLAGGPSDVPDVVITDVMLPGQDGLALIQQLRRKPVTQRTPMIVLTARVGADATAEGLAAGADDYITKPFSARELLARVRANHELHQQREKAIVTAQGREQQIRGALDTNRVIGTAVGIVMASYQLTAQQGFQLLVTASQNTNSKLRDIAARVVDTGALPFRPTMIDDLIIRVADTST